MYFKYLGAPLSPKSNEGFSIQIAGRMPLDYLCFLFSPGPVDPSTALHGGAVIYFRCPADDVFVGANIEELLGFINAAQHQAAIPGTVGHVGDIVFVATEEAPGGKVLIQHVELPFDLHGVAINGVLPLLWRIGVEVAKATAEKGGATHLPE